MVFKDDTSFTKIKHKKPLPEGSKLIFKSFNDLLEYFSDKERTLAKLYAHVMAEIKDEEYRKLFKELHDSCVEKSEKLASHIKN